MNAIQARMQAVVYDEYGPPEVLRIEEIDTPSPEANQILVKIHTASISFGDLIVRRFGQVWPGDFYMPLPMWLLGRMSYGFRKPRYGRLGHEFAGEVVALGEQVTKFAVGDRVFGFLGDAMGADAEYACIGEDRAVQHMPDNVSFEEAAVVPYGTFIALHLLRKVDLRPGQKVLVNGASGGIGSAVLQLSKQAGAEVTGVCGTNRMEFVRALGADQVIDYRAEDFTQNGQTYDLIFDVLGSSSFSKVKGSLTPGGTYLMSSFKGRDVLDMLRTGIAARLRGDRLCKRAVCALAIPEEMQYMAEVKRLLEAGVITAHVDRTFPLDQVPEAHRYAESADRRGNVAIAVAPNGRG